jgi:hypothetical protein
VSPTPQTSVFIGLENSELKLPRKHAWQVGDWLGDEFLADDFRRVKELPVPDLFQFPVVVLILGGIIDD